MASRGFVVENPPGDEEDTATRVTQTLRLSTLLVRLHYVFLSPLIVLALPPEAFLGQSVLAVLFVATVGLAGTVLRRKNLTLIASAILLVLLVWGKLSEDLFKTGSEDTAVLLVEFTMILFFMEASSVVMTFNREYERLRDREDEFSQKQRMWLLNWLRGLLSKQGRISLGATGISIVLLPLAGFTSIGNSQLAFTATMLFLAVVVLMFLLTHGREPEERVGARHSV